MTFTAWVIGVKMSINQISTLFRGAPSVNLKPFGAPAYSAAALLIMYLKHWMTPCWFRPVDFPPVKAAMRAMNALWRARGYLNYCDLDKPAALKICCRVLFVCPPLQITEGTWSDVACFMNIDAYGGHAGGV